MNIIKHEIRQNTKSLLLWSGIVGGLIFVCMMIYPEFGKQADSIEGLFENLGSFSAAFGLDKIGFSTAIGFYGIEAGAMLSLGGSMFAAILGIGMLAKEEGSHTAEFLLSTPMGRIRIIAEKLIAVVILIVAFNIICYGIGTVSFLLIEENIDYSVLLLYHVVQCIMHLEIGCICYGISAFLKKNSFGLGIGIAMLLYFVNMIANISNRLDWLKYTTPYAYSDASEILSNKQIDEWFIALGIGIGIFGILIAFVRYIKKDIAS